MSKVHTYAPPQVGVADAGDGTGNKLLVCVWPDGEQVVIVLNAPSCKQVAEALGETSGVQVVSPSQLPPGLRL